MYMYAFGGLADIPGNINIASFGNTTYRDPYFAGGALGYKSGPIRYDLQLNYINGKIKQFSFGSVIQTPVSGSSIATSGLVNIYYDFEDLNPMLAPFLGFGLGYSNVKVKFSSTTPTTTAFNQSNTVFSYQGSAGVTLNFSETIGFDLGYRYLRTSRANNFNSAYQAHLFNIGTTYRFEN